MGIWLNLLVPSYLGQLGAIPVPSPIVLDTAGKSGALFPNITFLYASGLVCQLKVHTGHLEDGREVSISVGHCEQMLGHMVDI